MADSPRFSKASFQEWKQARVNRPFLQFLEDQRQQLMADWGRGVSMDSASQVKARLLLELTTLEWREVANFYDIPTDETESGAQ